MTRCRFSQYALDYLRPNKPEREGVFLGAVKTRDGSHHVKVKWDDCKTISYYYTGFIEVLPEAPKP